MSAEAVVRAARGLAQAAPDPVVDRLSAALMDDPAMDREGAARLILGAHPSRNYALAAGELIDSWNRLCPELPPAAVAGALLASERAPSPAESLSLVYTGPATSGIAVRRTDQALVEVIDSARSELVLVSFVAGRLPAVKEAVGRAVSRGVRVRVVLESPEEGDWRISWDGGRGLADRSPNVTVLVWPRDRRATGPSGNVATLHAKFAVADTTTLFISSANLTEAALAMNLELGVLVEGGPLPRQARDLVDGLVRQGQLVAAVDGDAAGIAQWPEAAGCSGAPRTLPQLRGEPGEPDGDGTA